MNLEVKIKDLMIRDITSVLPDCNLENLIKILSRHRITGVPVVNQQQEVVGFISQHDIIKAILPNYLEIIDSCSLLTEFIQLSKRLKDYSHHKVEEFMNTKVITIKEEDNEVIAADLLIRNKIQRLPVVRQNKLVGVVTLTDICRILLESNEKNS